MGVGLVPFRAFDSAAGAGTGAGDRKGRPYGAVAGRAVGDGLVPSRTFDSAAVAGPERATARVAPISANLR